MDPKDPIQRLRKFAIIIEDKCFIPLAIAEQEMYNALKKVQTKRK